MTGGALAQQGGPANHGQMVNIPGRVGQKATASGAPTQQGGSGNHASGALAQQGEPGNHGKW